MSESWNHALMGNWVIYQEFIDKPVVIQKQAFLTDYIHLKKDSKFMRWIHRVVFDSSSSLLLSYIWGSVMYF